MTKQEQLKAEEQELNLLNGASFSIEIKNIFGKPKVYQAKKMTLGRLFKLSKIFITIDFDEEALNSPNIHEQLATQYRSVLDNIDKVAKVIAICVTDHPLMAWWVQRQVRKHYTPKDIQAFTQQLLKASDYGNFMLSIALMNGNRPTKAKAVEG